MRRLASFVLLLSACGGAARFKTEHAGGGVAVVSPRGGVALPAQTVAIGQGAYDLHLHFDVPRAQLVEWTVACPGADSQGSVGEPFEAYRERRLAQLKAERDNDRRNASAVTSALVGAFVPNATATAQSGPVRVDAQVSPAAAAGAAVAGSMDMNVQLPPGDVGAGPVETVVHLVTNAPGACRVTAIADDPNVMGRFELLRIRDLDREAREREAAIAVSGEHARAAIHAQLVGFGADLELRAKQQRAAAEAQAARDLRAHAAAQLEAARVSAEVHAQAQAQVASHERAAAEIRAREARQLQIVMEARLRWRLLLISWGADVNYRARLQAEADGRARIAAELEARRVRYALEIRLRLRLLLISWGADAEWRLHQQQLHEREELAERARLDAEIDARLDLALRARASVRASLVALGARERPPMPALRIENRGPVPFDGASWIAGHWTWSGAEWAWSAGGWTDQSVAFGAAGGEAAVEAPSVVVEQPDPVPTVVVETPSPIRSITVSLPVRVQPVRVRPAAPAKSSDSKVRDHRH